MLRLLCWFLRAEVETLSQRCHAPPLVATPPQGDPGAVAVAVERERAAAEIARLETLLEKEGDEKRDLQSQVKLRILSHRDLCKENFLLSMHVASCC